MLPTYDYDKIEKTILNTLVLKSKTQLVYVIIEI